MACLFLIFCFMLSLACAILSDPALVFVFRQTRAGTCSEAWRWLSRPAAWARL